MKKGVVALAVGLALGPGALRGEAPFRLVQLASDPAGGGDAALRPDGQAFVTSSRRGGNWDLWLYEIGPARWTQLTEDPAEDFEAQWSPDAGRLVFTSTRAGQKDVWVLELATGRLTQLTSSEYDEEYPRFSPDGRQVVYTGGPWAANDFFVIPADGSALARKATAESGRAGACAFEASGRSLVCHRYDTGNGDLLRLDLASGKSTPLTRGASWDYKPVGSPDGRWIAFSRATEGPSAVWLMPAAGGAGRAVVESGANDRWPSWSASGDRLFWHRMVSRGSVIETLDRGTGRRSTLVGPAEQPLQAALDPTGQRLVYCVQDGDKKALRVRSLGGGEPRKLSFGGDEACFPRVSPDGRTLGLTLRRGSRWEIATAAWPDGSDLQVWTAGKAGLRGLDGPLDFAPDGRSIVFQGDTLPFESDLYLLDLGDGTVRNLTQDAWFDEAPAFAPDGRSIVYMSTRGGGWTWGLYRLSLADGAVSVVAAPDYEEKNFPRFGPRGEVIWSYRDGAGGEHLIELAGADVRREIPTPIGARWPSYGPNGTVVYTVMTEHVEFWLAENLFGADSPLAPLTAPSAADAAPSTVDPAEPLLPQSSPQGPAARSPVDPFHR